MTSRGARPGASYRAARRNARRVCTDWRQEWAPGWYSGRHRGTVEYRPYQVREPRFKMVVGSSGLPVQVRVEREQPKVYRGADKSKAERVRRGADKSKAERVRRRFFMRRSAG